MAAGGAGERDHVEQAGVLVDHAGGQADQVVRELPVLGVGEDVAGRVQAGRPLFVALALYPEPQLNRGTEGQLCEVCVGDGLMTGNDVLHGGLSSLGSGRMRLEVPQQACAAGKGTTPDAVWVEPSCAHQTGRPPT